MGLFYGGNCSSDIESYSFLSFSPDIKNVLGISCGSFGPIVRFNLSEKWIF